MDTKKPGAASDARTDTQAARADRDQSQKTEPGNTPPSAQPSNDMSEGIIRDPVLYSGEVVSYVGDIGVKDPEYDANVRQVRITTKAGEAKVVPASEIMREGTSAQPKAAEQLDRPDGGPTAIIDNPVTKEPK